jgi:hypothetical protein
LSRADHYAHCHSFPAIFFPANSFPETPCIDTAKVLRRDALKAIHRLLSLPPTVTKATAHAFLGPQDHQGAEAGSGDGGSRGALVAACGGVEKDAAGTCRAVVGRGAHPLVR